ncbi:lantibiotic ABC transporter permease [Rubrobacter tropicus]|uniref:Lantibiotic ABC transporter permease n=1 Tax=Rubrobacter tropicus TaxID=2653851 RepID=A0A6G8QDM3_9ACTN|nr:ABC transporter permease [Rubrobacter tropicus]QIN84579.1 lantibiotic ABC transporter permease [Rubrobacter tropicus]
MNAKVIINEFAKMRRLRVWLVVGLLLFGVAGLTAFQASGSGLFSRLDDPDGFAWKLLLDGFAVALIAPVLLAVLASRQVEMEHLGNGWLLSATSGVTSGRLCRAKFLALGTLVVAATILQSLILIAFGLLAGITSPFPLEHWLGYTASAVVINLVVLAFHILLSAKIENQLVCLGIGVVGIFFGTFGQAFPDWLSHLTPWGYYALAMPADYVGMELVYLDLPYPSVLALAVVGSVLFLFVTSRFDRQEA